MELFVKVMNTVNDIVWHPVMCVFLMIAAVWFTVRLKGMQVRRVKDMAKCLLEKGDNKQDKALSPFQAFATTVGGRIGTGNIAGTATAIFMGGPGAVFWMWITAILGASTGMVECILGQAYKTRNLGELTGGPAFYMSKGIKNKTLGKILAVLFCIADIYRTWFFASGYADTDSSHCRKGSIWNSICSSRNRNGNYRWCRNYGWYQANRTGSRVPCTDHVRHLSVSYDHYYDRECGKNSIRI